MKKRTFTIEFKRQIVEEIIHGNARPVQICRKYNISKVLLWRWQKDYEQGRLTYETGEALPMQQRINELEKIVGRLTMDNELLKKALQQANSHSKKNEIFSAPIEINLDQYKGGALC